MWVYLSAANVVYSLTLIFLSTLMTVQSRTSHVCSDFQFLKNLTITKFWWWASILTSADFLLFAPPFSIPRNSQTISMHCQLFYICRNLHILVSFMKSVSEIYIHTHTQKRNKTRDKSQRSMWVNNFTRQWQQTFKLRMYRFYILILPTSSSKSIWSQTWLLEMWRGEEEI